MKLLSGWRVLGLVLALVVASTAHAQGQPSVPMLINHQGLLMSGPGVPNLAPLALMRFALWDQIEGGNELWSEEYQVEVIDGYYQVLLGSVDPVGLAEAFAASDELFLGIDVNRGGELAPRRRLVSVPWALRAATADRALVADNATGDLTPSSINVNPGGNISIGNSEVIDSSGHWRGAPIDAGNVVGQVGDASTFDGHDLDDFIVLSLADAPDKLSLLLGQVDVDADTLDGLDSSDFVQAGEGGVVDNADHLDDLDSLQFLRSDVNSRTTADLAVDGMLSVGGLTRVHSVSVAPGSRLGVGVPAPQAEVDVAGTVQAQHLVASDLQVKAQDLSPANPQPGTVYFDSATRSFRGWDGEAWVALSSSPLGTRRASPATSCLTILQQDPDKTSGYYWLQPVGVVEPFRAYCDMDTDGGGYTMVRVNDGALGWDQDAYRAMCGSMGMEVIVPVTKAHAMSIASWNNNEPPNLVNVFPRFAGAAGLANWQGICGGNPCPFWLSDTPSADCYGLEPDGDNDDLGDALFRIGSDCAYGEWDDAGDAMGVVGWVICSTNDKLPE